MLRVGVWPLPKNPQKSSCRPKDPQPAGLHYLGGPGPVDGVNIWSWVDTVVRMGSKESIALLASPRFPIRTILPVETQPLVVGFGLPAADAAAAAALARTLWNGCFCASFDDYATTATQQSMLTPTTRQIPIIMYSRFSDPRHRRSNWIGYAVPSAYSFHYDRWLYNME